MRSFLVFCFCVVVAAFVGACAAADVPTPDDGAAHLGLESGTTFTYNVSDGVTETHEVKASGVLFAGVSVDVLAKQNGFAADARTMSVGVDVTQASLLRFFDCIVHCGTLDQPIPFLNWPLTEGDVVTGEATVTVIGSNDGTDGVHNERHSTTVGPQSTVTVPAGDFDAFSISWTRTVIESDGSEETELTLLSWAPDVGIVKHEAADGTVLELSTKP